MAVNAEPDTVILLKMVRSERLAEVAPLADALRAQFPGARLLWATTETGRRILAPHADGFDILVLGGGGFTPGGLRAAARVLRAARPGACVLAYDNPRRRGNLLLELLALLSTARELHWTAEGHGTLRLGRCALHLRVISGLACACGLAVVGLLGGLVAGLILALAGALPGGRRALPRP